MRCLVVDDERSAREYLRDLLDEIQGIEVIGEAKDGLDAIDKINRLRPELVLLDIQMPVLNGLSLMPYLKHRPLIVFVTAYDQYAIDAFRVHAVDYLLKPVERQLLAETIQRAQHEWQKLQALHESQFHNLKTIVCRLQTKHIVVKSEHVLLIEKSGRYCNILTLDGKNLLTELSLDYLEQHLGSHFFRINRSSMVHVSAIDHFTTNTSGTGTLRLVIGDVVSISRARLAAFRKWVKQT